MAGALLGCGAGAVSVSAPQPPQAVREVCTSTVRALPDTVDGRDRRRTRPASPFTAAWGDPAVALRCGVGTPAGLTATSEVLEVNGVEWFLVESTRGYGFRTVGRRATVEVTVPLSVDRTEATAPLTDVAAAVRRHDPRT